MSDINGLPSLDTWAENGEAVQPSEQRRETGWGEGDQPPHEHMNYLQQMFTNYINHMLQHGVPLWSSERTYALNEMAKRDGVIYKALAENSNSQPPNINWQRVAPQVTQNSIETSPSGALQLVGDMASLAANVYYGTNSEGELGWHSRAQIGVNTGDYKASMVEAPLVGYVRANGRTIGSAASGATERANADCRALFDLMWAANSSGMPVNGGRGASAEADWNANKRITLPDARHRVLGFVDGMGSANTNLMSNIGAGIGEKGGEQEHQLTVAEMPRHRHNSSADDGDEFLQEHGDSGDAVLGARRGDEVTGYAGGDEPHNNLQPTFIAGTLYIKL